MTFNKWRRRQKYLCKMKVKYNTVAEAVAKINFYRQRPVDKLKPELGGWNALEVYKCPACEMLHIGHHRQYIVEDMPREYAVVHTILDGAGVRDTASAYSGDGQELVAESRKATSTN